MAPEGNTQSLGIDAELGAGDSRFFGSGYRNVSHTLRTVRHNSDVSNGVASIDYPENWSLKPDHLGRLATRTPHLSTIDVIATCARTLEQHWPHTGYDYISRISLRAGTRPWDDLGHVPIEVRQVHDSSEETRYEAIVGNIRAWLDIRLAGPRQAPVWTGAATVYGHGYKTIRSHARITRFSPHPARLVAKHTFHLTEPGALYEGLGSGYFPSPTPIDYLVAMGELSQSAMSKGYGLARSSGDLWMKSLDLHMPGTPTCATGELTSISRTAIERIHRTEDMSLALISASVRMSNGVTGRGKLVFASPNDLIGPSTRP